MLQRNDPRDLKVPEMALVGHNHAAELADGADVAFFGIVGVDVSTVAFVEVNGSLKAGHAAHPQCSTDASPCR